jgi:succinate dehydrogenase flavin-adding protein (antitoxin of CptAB toxin-antitoxin module)
MDSRSIERLKWRSRRGLLELDIVFQRYWKAHDGGMPEAEAKVLERLLLLPDNDLLDLVMGRATTRDAAFAALVEKLKAA